MKVCTNVLVAIALFVSGSAAQAQIRITEWEYNGSGSVATTAGEFIELMNIGTTPINMAGWSYDDSSRAAGSFSLAAFGIVAPKEIVIVAETSAADFYTKWNLPASVKVIGLSNQNLSRNDEINIYDNLNALVDRLTFNDELPVGVPSPRTQGFSGNPLTIAALGANDKFQWKLSAALDAYGSYATAEGNVGNPGKFALIPEPASLTLFVLGAVAMMFRRRVR